MERELSDEKTLDPEELNEMEERRVNMLNEAMLINISISGIVISMRI
jgi:hypothetical protein